MFKVFIKSMTFAVLANSLRVNHRVNKIKQNSLVTILNLHRVSEADGSAYQPLSPKLFQELLKFCKENFEITTFTELNESKSIKPKLILSFDDGYKDFIDIAVPMLDKLDIKVNQNIIPACVLSGLPPLNVIAQNFIGKAPLSLLANLVIPGLDIKKLLNDRLRLGHRVSAYIKNKTMAEQNALRDDLMFQFYKFDELVITSMMNKNDISQLINIHEFGAHSYSHANLGVESDAYFMTDLQGCKQFFTDELKSNVDIYAFPNGSYREKQVLIAQNAGFKHVLLVDNKFSNLNTNFFPRFGFYANSKSEVIFRATGATAEIV